MSDHVDVRNATIPEVVEIADRINNAVRARWDETKFFNEKTNEIIGHTQYDVTLDLRDNSSVLFSYREFDSDPAWFMQVLTPVEIDETDNDVDENSDSWKSRHERDEIWLRLPVELAKLLWDILTMDGPDAKKRRWGGINPDDGRELNEEPDPSAQDAATKAYVDGVRIGSGDLARADHVHAGAVHFNTSANKLMIHTGHNGGWTEVNVNPNP